MLQKYENIRDSFPEIKSEQDLNHLLQYYIDPVSGRRFRSKIEVLRFLETGTVKKAKTENASVDKTVSQNCFCWKW